MTKKSILTLFSGGELAGVGARAAGYEHIGGVEIDPDIAAVAKMNGFDLTVADIMDVSPGDFGRPRLLHASPVCKNASIANPHGVESQMDLATARKVADFIRFFSPDLVTIENVIGYRKFEGFKEIIRSLADGGYMYDVQILNAADFGVPQSRRRLFVRAVRDGLIPFLPAPVGWVGWYEAIEDLLDDLPETEFANWQIARLPLDIQTCMIGQQKYGEIVQNAPSKEPSYTITAKSSNRCFLFAAGGNTNLRQAVPGKGIRTISASQKAAHRAWLSSGRVVKISSRALARLQSLPDSYLLPSKATLAGEVIGNGVPPLMYQRIVEAFG